MAPEDPRADRLVKIPYALFRRCDALQDAVGADPDVGPLLGRISVVAVIRVALFEGLQVLERRYSEEGDTNAR
jgi:hypothetical protein